MPTLGGSDSILGNPAYLQIPVWTGSAWAGRSNSGIKNSTTPEAYGATGNNAAHDDAPAIEAAIFAMVAACIADASYVCEVVFDGGKSYYANRAPIRDQTINGVHSYANAQISLPYVAWEFQNATPLVTLILRSQASGQASNTTFSQQSCSIVTTVTTSPGLASQGIPSVLGGPGFKAVGTAGVDVPPKQWSGINLIWDGVNIVSPQNPALAGLDFTRINTVDLRSCHVMVATNGYFNTPTAPTVPTSHGVRFPANQNGGNIRVGTLGVYGYYVGIGMPEHLRAENLMLYWNKTAISLDDQSDHESLINYLQTTFNTNLVAFSDVNTGPASVPSGTFPPIVVNLWGMEDLTANILDANNILRMEATLFNVGATTQRIPTITGGGNCRFTSLNQSRGSITAPAVPATTVAYKNAYGRDAWVAVTGGTVTVVAIDGVSTGLTSGQFVVPRGKTITLTYSVAPTWGWWLF